MGESPSTPNFRPDERGFLMFHPTTLWRAFFCAVGIVLVIGGLECLLIDSAILTTKVTETPSMQASGGLFSATPSPVTRNSVFKPSDWFPWSLLASGAIVMLYSYSLRRNGSM